jgi:hypothetical protein
VHYVLFDALRVVSFCTWIVQRAWHTGWGRGGVLHKGQARYANGGHMHEVRSLDLQLAQLLHVHNCIVTRFAAAAALCSVTYRCGTPTLWLAS